MNDYSIAKLVKTTVILRDPVSVSGMDLRPARGGILVSKSLPAEDYKEALDAFDVSCLGLLDALLVVCKVGGSTYGTMTLTQKTGSRHAFISGWREREEHRVCDLTKETVDLLQRVSATLDSDTRLASACRLMRESFLAGQAPNSARNVLGAAEALCGRNRAALADLLGSELFDYFFGSGGRRKKGVRNDLSHGYIVNQRELAFRNEQLRRKVVPEIEKRLDLDPGRVTLRLFSPAPLQMFTVWVELTADPWPDALWIIEAATSGDIGECPRLRELPLGEQLTLESSF